MSHTSIGFQQIGDMTIPQIEAVLARIGRHISLKLGIPQRPSAALDEEHSVDDAMSFVQLFQDIG